MTNDDIDAHDAATAGTLTPPDETPGFFARLRARLSNRPAAFAPGGQQLLAAPTTAPEDADAIAEADVASLPRQASHPGRAPTPPPAETLDQTLTRIKRTLARDQARPVYATQTIRLETPFDTDVLAGDPMRPTRVATSLVNQLPAGSRIVSLNVEIPTG